MRAFTAVLALAATLAVAIPLEKKQCSSFTCPATGGAGYEDYKLTSTTASTRLICDYDNSTTESAGSYIICGYDLATGEIDYGYVFACVTQAECAEAEGARYQRPLLLSTSSTMRASTAVLALAATLAVASPLEKKQCSSFTCPATGGEGYEILKLSRPGDISDGQLICGYDTSATNNPSTYIVCGYDLTTGEVDYGYIYACVPQAECA
ncbi:hypothetical protein BD626DRAFT_567950 [Schizophyllum amplum]|uniref:Uncharacterized protein n=1 Tax=Schizophyllum amplum TaxID=97359 RepID=A0A550CK10_9AGAR|nr:hypothetical protein BD626DRAFT_567950 [Auriculariopsis ampla]